MPVPVGFPVFPFGGAKALAGVFKCGALTRMLRFSLFSGALLSCLCQAPPPPGMLFNLSSFGLQLPISNGKGGVEQVYQPSLRTYSSPYFFTDAADRGMVFWCPENGATTSGSGFPRSELREEFDFGLAAGGRHVLNTTITVVLTNSSKASVTIGQAHIDGISGHCSIFVELMWTAGTVVAHLRDKGASRRRALPAPRVAPAARRGARAPSPTHTPTPAFPFAQPAIT